MIKKGSKLYSILLGVCPKCHKRSMYLNPNPYQLSDLMKMKESCESCKTKFRIEPSFFYGSMYVSYALGIAFGVAAFIISHVFLSISLLPTFFVIVGTEIILYPVILRLSRNIWINFFMQYSKELANKANRD